MTDSTAHQRPVTTTGDGAVVVHTSPHRTRLVISGDADAVLSTELSRATEDALRIGLPVDLDVRDVTFMDSSTVAALGWLAYQLPHRPRVIEPPDIVRFLLELTQLHDVMDIREHDPGFPST